MPDEIRQELVNMTKWIGVAVKDRYARVVLRCLEEEPDLPRNDYQIEDEVKYNFLKELDIISAALE